MTVDVAGKINLNFAIYVNAWPVDGATKYDWTAQNGDSSDELFDSYEEAKESALEHFGA